MKDYECWRVAGSLKSSMDSCPVGSSEECMILNMGCTCPGGREVRL